MTNKIDEIDRAEKLLTEASNSAADSASLATQAIGLLLLYFAKDQRDATQKLASVMLDLRLQEYKQYLKMLGLHEQSGGKK